MTKQPRAIKATKRVIIYLLLGFITSWIVAWVVTEIPRRVSMQRIARSQTIIENPEINERGFINIYDFRWFGVFERQYTPQSRFNSRSARDTIHFWWTWNVIPQHFVKHREEWEAIKAKNDLNTFPPDASQYSIMRFGWPALCFEAQGAVNTKNERANGSLPSAIKGAFTSRVIDRSKYFKGKEASPMAGFVWFPYRPIWSGLIVNTLLFAFVIFVCVTTIRAIRHGSRMLRGRCPICNYELAFDFSDGCPECGWRKEPTTTRSS